MDRLSSLPGHLLCHMLSLLPTKNAVASSILSTRWKYLWASVPIPDFDAGPLQDFHPVVNINEDSTSEITFQNLVSRVLLLNDMPYIRKFRLIYECHHKPAPIRTWFRVAITHNIEELELDLCLAVRGLVVNLPRKFFTSSNLVVLKLSRMPFKVPSVVCFPSLKILELRRIIILQDKCIEILLSGCQALQELVIEEISRQKSKVVEISLQTLKSFSFSYRYVVDMMDCPYKFIINTPNLEYFHVKGSISDVFEVRNSSSLNNARLDLRRTAFSSGDYVTCQQHILHLLEGISNAKSIALSGDAVLLLCEGFNQNLPKFSNLTELAFGIGFDLCWKWIVTEFIKYSPFLEVFTLHNKQGFSRNMEDVRESPLEPLPDNLVSHLKKMLVDELYANFMPEYIEYMVHHVNVLKRLEINGCCPITLTSQIGLTP